jgi:hypothetical protein
MDKLCRMKKERKVCNKKKEEMLLHKKKLPVKSGKLLYLVGIRDKRIGIREADS